jgi:hypothetical protein
MSFQYSQVKGLVQLTSREFNGQAYGQNPPVSVSTAFATSNLVTFVKESLYKSTPRHHKQRDGVVEEIHRSPHHTKEKESTRCHHRHPFLHLKAIAIYL